MSAWKQNAPDDRWYLMDMTHASYNAVKAACGTRHRLSPRAGLLSVYVNNAGTQAIVKVADAGAWTPPPAAVIRTYTPADLHELQALVQTPAWARPTPTGPTP